MAGKEAGSGASGDGARPTAGSWLMVAVAWMAVGAPLLWGVAMTLKKAALLFR